jgi:glycine cleavage system regulatory protein
MLTSLVMTVIGPDRPGLVDSVAEVVTVHEGNWLESRMSRLGGQFAGILRIEIASEREPDFMAALRSLETSGLQVVVHQDPSVTQPVGDLRILEVVGHDRPGIVRQISRALASHGVNVEEFTSEVASAAMSGEPLFKARAKVMLPDGCDPDALQLELEQVAADLIVELSFAKPAAE